jgi:hypothetical protein
MFTPIAKYWTVISLWQEDDANILKHWLLLALIFLCVLPIAQESCLELQLVREVSVLIDG